jgi:hypothetical protein
MVVVYKTNKGNHMDTVDKFNEMFSGRQMGQDVKHPHLDEAVCLTISLKSVAARASTRILWINIIHTHIYIKK